MHLGTSSRSCEEHRSLRSAPLLLLLRTAIGRIHHEHAPSTAAARQITHLCSISFSHAGPAVDQRCRMMQLRSTREPCAHHPSSFAPRTALAPRRCKCARNEATVQRASARARAHACVCPPTTVCRCAQARQRGSQSRLGSAHRRPRVAPRRALDSLRSLPQGSTKKGAHCAPALVVGGGVRVRSLSLSPFFLRRLVRGTSSHPLSSSPPRYPPALLAPTRVRSAAVA